MNSTFAKATTRVVAPPDPHKYVNYTQGMLLSVDDFIQEHTYLTEHVHWLARTLSGYGTIAGLRVFADVDEKQGPLIYVTPGVALSPYGELVRITATQCAALNDWLAVEKQDAQNLTEGPLTLSVVLSYSATASDKVPVAGEAGHYTEAQMIPSRLTDDFALDLRFQAPDQSEEEAERRFVAWLRQVRVSTSQAEHYSEPGHFVEVLRKAAAHAQDTTPASFMSQPPPADLVIPETRAPEYWRRAFALWATELRPRWQGSESGDAPEEGALLLAKLHMHIKQATDGSWSVVIPENAHPIRVHEDERPYLLNARLLQEWLIAGRHETAPIDMQITEVNAVQINEEIEVEHDTRTLAGDVTGAIDDALTVQALQHVPIAPDAPTEGQFLAFNGERWEATSPPTSSVEHPPELGSYIILAAGHVRCDGTSSQPTYNELVAKTYADGQVSVQFKGYVQPKDAPYIISVLPVWNQKQHLYHVFLEHFQQEFLSLRVVNLHGDPIKQNELKPLELIIEIKQYTNVAKPQEVRKRRTR